MRLFLTLLCVVALFPMQLQAQRAYPQGLSVFWEKSFAAKSLDSTWIYRFHKNGSYEVDFSCSARLLRFKGYYTVWKDSLFLLTGFVADKDSLSSVYFLQDPDVQVHMGFFSTANFKLLVDTQKNRGLQEWDRSVYPADFVQCARRLFLLEDMQAHQTFRYVAWLSPSRGPLEVDLYYCLFQLGYPYFLRLADDFGCLFSGEREGSWANNCQTDSLGRLLSGRNGQICESCMEPVYFAFFYEGKQMQPNKVLCQGSVSMEQVEYRLFYAEGMGLCRIEEYQLGLLLRVLRVLEAE